MDRPALTKYPPASLRELVFLSFPLILGLFSSSFMGFCDRLFLSHFSLEALEGSVSAGYLCTLFQHPAIRLAIIAQVFVGLYYGSNRKKEIGSVVWQMIWLSFLSMIVSYPLSRIIAPFIFKGTSIQGPAQVYFSVMMAVNFLFPLGTAISAYFIGRGKMRVIFLTTLLAHGLNIGLDYLFIFGVEGFLPAMGIFGAALATAISQTLFCLILLLFFLRKKDREEYGTDQYHFHWDRFWGQVRIGSPRALARMVSYASWVCISRIMTLKGGDYLMVLSIGGTLILLFTFVNDGMYQGMITIASNLMGSKEYSNIWKLVRSGTVLLLITTALLAIPYLFTTNFILSFFFSFGKPNPTTYAMLKHSCLWLWLFFFCYGYETIGLSLVTAARDMRFYLLAVPFTWLTSYIPVYFAMNVFNWAPDKLWLIMALNSLCFGSIFLLRAAKEKWREMEHDPSRILSN